MPKLNSMPNRQPHCKQSGVVMILFAVSMVVLIGFMALVIDLGRTYVVRTELQNAADAAALAGAKELKQTATGVANAVDFANAMAAQHTFNFGKTVNSTNAVLVLTFGKCPGDEEACDWKSQADSLTDPVGRSYLKVDIRSRSLATFFAGVLGAATTETFGSAVAGYALVNVTPIGVCAIDTDHPTATTPAGELLEYGFRRGVGYNIYDLSPMAPGNHYLINPVDRYVTGAAKECNTANGTPGVVAPFLCTGESAAIPLIPDASGKKWVYGDTGMSSTLNDALNSRFDPAGKAKYCSPESAPPDKNVKDYSIPAGVDWMNPTPTQQSLTKDKKVGLTSYGALWSYSRAVKALGGTYSTTDWATLYPAVDGVASPPVANGNYPTSSAPYADTSNPAHFVPPSGGNGVADRRVLKLAIIKCPSASSGSCAPLEVLAIGRFFMQRPADIPKSIDVEFDGTTGWPGSVEIKLYR